MKPTSIAFWIVAGFMLLLVALFPLLAADSVANLVARRGMMEPGNFALILFLEVSRGATTLIALLAAGMLMIRSGRRTDGRALLLFVLFLALTYQKIFGAISLPGPWQERLTMWLLGNGVSRPVLVWLFGPVLWSVWPALAAIMRFSVVFPQPPLSPQLIDASGAHDRQGMMRGAGVAGADIGAVFRGLSKKLLATGAYRPLPLLIGTLALIVLTTVLDKTGRLVLLVVAGSIATGIVITNVRAAFNVVVPEQKARMRWPIRGFLAAAGMVVLASLPLLAVDIPAATVPALVIVMVAAAIIMLCIAAAALWFARLPRQTHEVLV
jgi:hypothetical protein